jgi:hypothetical protein
MINYYNLFKKKYARFCFTQWFWDAGGNIWGTLSVTGDHSYPSGRIGSQGASMSLVNKCYYVFGGEDSSTFHGDVWYYNSDTVTWNTYTRAPLAAWPGARKSHRALVRPADADKFYIFGGTGPYSIHGDMWSFTTTSGVWTPITPATGCQAPARSPAGCPPPVTRHCAVYDADRDAAWVWHGTFGPAWASCSTGFCLDAASWLFRYSWASNTWTNFTVNATSLPLSRNDACAWYMNHTLYMFGGQTADPEFVQNGLFMLNLTRFPYTWVRLQYTNEPLGRMGLDCQVVPPVALSVTNTDPTYRGLVNPGVVLFGGLDNVGYSNQLLYLDMTRKAFIDFNPNTLMPSPRSFTAMAIVGTPNFFFSKKNISQILYMFFFFFFLSKINIRYHLVHFWGHQPVFQCARRLVGGHFSVHNTFFQKKN